MPRARSLFPVALSIRAASDALGLDREGRIIREAIDAGALEAFELPARRIRIPVVSLVEWLRKFPRATKRKQRRVPDGNA